MKKFLRFFEILEDKIRHILSHWPIIYAIIGIIGISLAWRGVWHFADEINMSPLFSFILGVIVLLASGLLVAVAIGDEVIISSFRGRKKINEVRLEETLTMIEKIDDIKNLLDKIEKRLGAIKQEEEKIEKEAERSI